MVVDLEVRAARSASPVPVQRPRRGDHPLVFLVPAFAVLAVFFVLPTVFNFVYAFTDWSSFKPGIAFAGLENFQTLLADGSLLSSLRITLVYAVLVAIFQNLFGLTLALLLEPSATSSRRCCARTAR
jgi:multiple sugar transport system permease protein/raffinose/stachyose/melibiose transport system permease protein